MILEKMLINGELVESESGRWLDCIAPASEQVVGQVPLASAKDVGEAVEAAETAFPAWERLGVEGRAKYLNTMADKLAERSEEIAALEAMDTGNTYKYVIKDMEDACGFLRFYAGLGWEVKGETIPSTSGNLHFTVREPYGVVAKIVPFNHPVMFASRIGAPLIAGNTVILKVPREASLSICRFAAICRDVFPPGTVNIITGAGSEAGDAIVRHPKIKRIGFIGSEQTGLDIQRAAAESAVKLLTLELGGKNPMIVFPDANLEKAIPSVLGGMSFAWSGQSCGSVSRLFLHDSIYDEFLSKLAALADNIIVGDPMDENSGMGPIIHKKQYEKVLYYINAGKEDGARLVSGGNRPEGELFKKGYWVRPTIFADVTPDMRIYKEEIFGPVLSVIRWSDTEDVIRLANGLNLGLTGSVWSQNLNTALSAARQIQSGTIWINGVSNHFKAAPFGGYKNSGIGKEESLSEIVSYTQEKLINIFSE